MVKRTTQHVILLVKKMTQFLDISDFLTSRQMRNMYYEIYAKP